MKKVLLFHVNVFKAQSIRLLLDELGIETVIVPLDQENRLVADLAGMASSGRSRRASLKPASVEGEMAVFCGMDREDLDQVLSVWKQNQQMIALKAMLTKTNAAWTPGQLYQELSKEHAFYQKKNI